MSKIPVFTLLITIFLTPSLVFGAVIHGTIYEWSTLKPLDGVIVEVNSTPKRVMSASNASYFFNLSPGNYVIKAKYYKNGVLEYYCEENITLTKEGDYVLDLFMLPASFEETLLENAGEKMNIEESFTTPQSHLWVYILTLILAIVIISIILYRTKKRGEKLPRDLPDDLREIMEVITQEGGRITQAELRKRLSYSEAKISLMLSDLENRGLIKKIKKGRGNIIIKL